jgi:hypothetical protein
MSNDVVNNAVQHTANNANLSNASTTVPMEEPVNKPDVAISSEKAPEAIAAIAARVDETVHEASKRPYSRWDDLARTRSRLQDKDQ